MKIRKGRPLTKAELQAMAAARASAKKISQYIDHSFVDRWMPKLAGFGVSANGGCVLLDTREAAITEARECKRRLRDQLGWS